MGAILGPFVQVWEIRLLSVFKYSSDLPSYKKSGRTNDLFLIKIPNWWTHKQRKREIERDREIEIKIDRQTDRRYFWVDRYFCSGEFSNSMWLLASRSLMTVAVNYFLTFILIYIFNILTRTSMQSGIYLRCINLLFWNK